ncbi:MAG: hypothetical protein EAX95_07880 [Candidatus Thorarchaeota archaeon]|nr:hypothetical protein [Candidatus Thorarchaeota archaeon]
MIPEQNDDEEVEMKLAAKSKTSETAKKVAVAAILASLSVAVSPIALVIPRIPGFGIAVFDPISIFWMIAFLVGGFWVGLVSMVTGAFMLNFFDPFPIFGPLLKFLATFPMIVLPWLAVRNAGGEREYWESEVEEERPDPENPRGALLSKGRFFAVLMVFSYVIRISLMVPVNLVVVPFIWGVTDAGFIITYTLILNTLQSFWDALIPFIVIHRTPIFSNYGMW